VNQQSDDLIKRAALASLPWAAGFAAVLVVTGLIPCCGLIVYPAGAFGIAWIVTPKLGLWPTPETKQNLAINIGLGVGLTATVALLVATLLGQLLGLLFVAALGAVNRDPSALAFGLPFGLLSLGIYLAVALIGGLAIGILCAYLGGLAGLEQVRPAGHS
jgi:hypothetical protein